MKYFGKYKGLAIIAVVLLLFSCSDEYVPREKIQLEIRNYNSGSIVFVGEEAVIQVKEKGNVSTVPMHPHYRDTDISDEVEIYVNGERIEGNKFTPTDTGVYTVEARYLGHESGVLRLEAQTRGVPKFKKNVVVEQYTADNCNWSPSASHALEVLKSKTEQIVPIAIHAGDVMSNEHGMQLIRHFDTPLLYSPMLDRKEFWREFDDMDENDILEKVTNRLHEKAFLGLKLTSTVEDDNLDLNVQVMFGNKYPRATKIVVFVIEDGIVQDQANATKYYPEITTEGVAKGFVHNFVLRHALTSVAGDEMHDASFISNNTYERNFGLRLPTNVEDITKVRFVAMVLDEKTEEVLNARWVHAGESNEFEFLNE